MNVNSFISWLESRDQNLTRCKETLELFPEIGLVDVKISNRHKTVAGLAHGSRQITLAKKMFAEGINEVLDTFLHELGHVLNHHEMKIKRVPRKSHGLEWRQWCHVIGLPHVKQFHKIAAMKPRTRKRKVVGHCHTCETQIWQRKKLNKKITYICLQCKGYITKL